jgi:hypothetical protein
VSCKRRRGATLSQALVASFQGGDIMSSQEHTTAKSASCCDQQPGREPGHGLHVFSSAQTAWRRGTMMPAGIRRSGSTSPTQAECLQHPARRRRSCPGLFLV